MIIEYLINSENAEWLIEVVNKYNSVEKKKDNKIEFSSTKIRGKTSIFRIFTMSNNIQCAKKLSSLDEELIKTEGIIALITDEVSAYYNESLFPYINRFERLLRRLLCIKVSFLDENEKIDVEIDKKNKVDIREAIKKLEELDFGKIHENFLVDKSLNERIRNELNNNPSKTELINYINTSEDNSFWSRKVDEKELLPIRDHFLELKDYRNDVMHAHKVNYIRFNKALKLFKSINKSLDKATKELIKPIREQSKLINLADVAQSVVNIIGAIGEDIQLNVDKYAVAFSNFCEVMSVMANKLTVKTLEDMSIREPMLQDVSVLAPKSSLEKKSSRQSTLQDSSTLSAKSTLEEMSSKPPTLQDMSMSSDKRSLKDISQRNNKKNKD